jgi:predicted acetyltransferase
MKTSRTTPALDIRVVPAAPEQEPVLANMLELYAHDFSEFVDLKLGADGRFGYSRLKLYWEEPGRRPFIIKADGHLAGFAFVRKGSAVSGDADVWDMAEFFVVRGFRGLGVGTGAARDIWRMFPGRWEVRVMDCNQKACAFWRRAVGEFLGEASEPTPFAEEGRGWRVFSFTSEPAA